MQTMRSLRLMCIYSTYIDNDEEKYWKLEITKQLPEKNQGVMISNIVFL